MPRGTGCEYRTATAKDQPEGADQLGTHAFTQGHAHEPFLKKLNATTAQAQLLDEGLLTRI
jgi:hypothetical protein